MFKTAILSIDLGLLIGLLALQHRQIGVSVAGHSRRFVFRRRLPESPK